MTIVIDQFINREKLFDYTSQCIECGECLEACCTFIATQKSHLSPMGRLGILSGFFDNGKISAEDVESIYLCTECGKCDTVCSEEIPISEVIADSKVALTASDDGPLPQHNKMIASIYKNGNAVNGKPENRLDWIPEKYRENIKFEDTPSDTLLYVGCLSSFVDKQTATASYEVLMEGGFDFKILKDEFCCGIYPYNAGKIDDAEKIFQSLLEKFKKAGVKKIIVPCAGCHRTFSKYYPRLLKSFDFQVLHISEVILDLIENKRLNLTKSNGTITYHDACKTGRKAGLYEIPRKVLTLCGYEINELKTIKEDGACCGSGSGVRSIDRELSMSIADVVLSDAKSSKIISTCPFCIFNFNYTAHKKSHDKKAMHIAVLVRDCLA